MRKLLLALCIAAALGFVQSAKADSIVSKIALWPANRVLDALDTFSVSVSLGSTVRGELMATEYCKVGGGIGYSAGLIKDYDRQYGIGMRNGWYWSLVTAQQEELARTGLLGSVKSYQQVALGVPDIQSELYDFYDGERDFWRIGGALGLLLEGELYIHPVEFADFVAGIFFIDLRADDLTSDDFGY